MRKDAQINISHQYRRTMWEPHSPTHEIFPSYWRQPLRKGGKTYEKKGNLLKAHRHCTWKNSYYNELCYSSLWKHGADDSVVYVFYLGSLNPYLGILEEGHCLIGPSIDKKRTIHGRIRRFSSNHLTAPSKKYQVTSKEVAFITKHYIVILHVSSFTVHQLWSDLISSAVRESSRFCITWHQWVL